MKLNRLFFAILVTTLFVFAGCGMCIQKNGISETEIPKGRHAAIVIDGSEQFGTYTFDGAERSHLPFYVYVPYINPDLIPNYAVWHWGNQNGRFSLKGKKWPIGKIKFQCGKLRTTQSYYEDKLVVEVYYQQRLSRHDQNGKLHYQYQSIKGPLAKGSVNVVCWGKHW